MHKIQSCCFWRSKCRICVDQWDSFSLTQINNLTNWISWGWVEDKLVFQCTTLICKVRKIETNLLLSKFIILDIKSKMGHHLTIHVHLVPLIASICLVMIAGFGKACSQEVSIGWRHYYDSEQLKKICYTLSHGTKILEDDSVKLGTYIDSKLSFQIENVIFGQNVSNKQSSNLRVWKSD